MKVTICGFVFIFATIMNQSVVLIGYFLKESGGLNNLKEVKIITGKRDNRGIWWCNNLCGVVVLMKWI